MKKQTDSHLFIRALVLTGLWSVEDARGPLPYNLYNDKRKNNKRRLKLAEANFIFNSSAITQQLLHKYMRRIFGVRYLYGEFIRYDRFNRTAKSLCIYLRDI